MKSSLRSTAISAPRLSVEASFVYDKVESTQDLARSWLASRPSSQGVVWVRARRQTRGRGRQGRRWENAAFSPASSSSAQLLVSAGFFAPPRLQEALSLVPLWAGLLLLNAVESHARCTGLFLKWPNDLVYDAGPARGLLKLGGILVEGFGAPSRSRGPGLVIGWGLNVHEAPEGVGALALAELSAFFRGSDACEKISASLMRLLETEASSWAMGRTASGEVYEDALIENLERDAMRPLWGRWGQGASGIRARIQGLAGSGALQVIGETGRALEVVAGEFRVDRS